MKSKIIRRDFDKIEIALAIQEKQIHLILIAANEPSLYMTQVCDLGGMIYQDASMLANRVNNVNETGTLHPKFAITIVPLSIFRERNNFGDRIIMKRNIEDCFLANEKLVQAMEVYFALEDRPDFDKILAIELINEVGARMDFVHTQIITYTPVNGL
jgi:hypothetical protein